MPPRLRTSSAQPATLTSLPSSVADNSRNGANTTRAVSRGRINSLRKRGVHVRTTLIRFRVVERNVTRQASLSRARSQRSKEMAGFIVTWDVDSKDRAQCARVRRFIFGETVFSKGRTYVHAGCRGGRRPIPWPVRA